MRLKILLLAAILSMIAYGKTNKNYINIAKRAEISSNGSARKLLFVGRHMVTSGTIVRGSCWNYLNRVYNKAGFGHDNRKIVYKKGKRGPYAPTSIIKKGDWLYYINHSYGGVEHSGMFISWTNRSKKQALILSYGGERRRKPGRYRIYDLSSVYQITRAKAQ